MKVPCTITLDKELVEKAQELLFDEGAKLSPVLNNLLYGWVRDMEKRREEEDGTNSGA